MQANGLIPARAGNTCTQLSFNFTCRAHPRSRGEHERNFHVQALDEGSSPLARGTHLGLLMAGEHDGLIPARAGNTAMARLWQT